MGQEVTVECCNHFAHTQQFLYNAKRTLVANAECFLVSSVLLSSLSNFELFCGRRIGFKFYEF